MPLADEWASWLGLSFCTMSPRMASVWADWTIDRLSHWIEHERASGFYREAACMAIYYLIRTCPGGCSRSGHARAGNRTSRRLVSAIESTYSAHDCLPAQKKGL